MEIELPEINLQIRQMPIEMPQSEEEKKENLEDPDKLRLKVKVKI